MKELFAKYKNLLLFIGIVAVLFIGYSVFFGNKETEVLTRAQATDTGESVVGRELLSTLLELRSITLDEKIFGDEVFRTLVDFSQPILPLPVGRENPFAPLPGSIQANPSR